MRHCLLLLALSSYVSVATAQSLGAFYNPEFTPGVGCGFVDLGGIDNAAAYKTELTSTLLVLSNGTDAEKACKNAPTQATNGAGALCFNSAEACNKVFSVPEQCVRDTAACATGYAGGYLANVYVSRNDPAYFTETTTVKGLPNGAGHVCFAGKEICEKAMKDSSGARCELDVATCATGAAGPTAYNWISVIHKPDPELALPTAAGILCFKKKEKCQESNNNPCDETTPCEVDTMTCSSGQAGPYAEVHYACKKNYPPGSSTNGAGQFCYSTFADCVGGPNACTDDIPCTEDAATCATGPAGPTPKNWFCPKDTPLKSLPNGGGQMCYSDAKACLDGPNACLNDEKLCEVNTATCANGIAGPSPYNTFCVYDQPNTAMVPDGKAIKPGSLPAAAGGLCYQTQKSCLDGPNACFTEMDCLQDYSTCSTGQAGPTDFWYYCSKDTPVGSITDGGGQLCYDSPKACFNGPNACGVDIPCALDTPTCSTGPAGPTPNNFYCEPDTPKGLQSNTPALSAGSGTLCWDSIADCVGGPNGCTAAGKDCVLSNLTQIICMSGQAAANDAGNNIACLKDIPTGGSVNAAGKWCYDTLDNCHKGPNACTDNLPCTSNPPSICSTAGKTSTFFCAGDYPVDVTKGVTSAGDICYPTPLACMNGPNACNTSHLCTKDEGMAASCKGSTYSWYCQLNVASKRILTMKKSSSARMTPTDSHVKLTVALLCTGLVLAGVRV